jgi:hypothetical protein
MLARVPGLDRWRWIWQIEIVERRSEMTIDWTKPIQVAATDWGQGVIPAEVVRVGSGGCVEVRVQGAHRVERVENGANDFDAGEVWNFWKDTGKWCYGDEAAIRIENVPEATAHQVGGKHYTDCVIQPIDYITKNGLGFCEGNVVKYITRWRKKGGVEDLKKARHYIDLLIEAEGKE